MKQYGRLKEYSVLEINAILEVLRQEYDLVRIVDVEECRILDVQPGGAIHYGDSCFHIWNRTSRCANCSSYRACMTMHETDKDERLGHDREHIHSVPIYLELLDGELELCVLECVKYAGAIGPDELNSSGNSYVSTHDVLTRLYTQEKLIREIRRALLANPDERYMMVMGNIRNFGMVNKLYGHECGNRILVGIADLLRADCTPEEVYGRYRDDRFVLLIKKDRFDETGFIERLQRIAQLVESPIYTLQFKLGIFEIDDVNLPVTTMIEHAGLAVNAIRDARDETIAHYEPTMLAQKLRDQHIVANFEQSLADGEFQIYLQPQVRADGSIVGGEALVRWLRSDGTVVPPGDFLHVLHQSELLSHLDMYVWEQAVRLLSRWRGTPLEKLYVSINADPTDFHYMDVPKLLEALCVKYGVQPNRLRVEITETALVEDVQRQNDMVKALQGRGFLVEIDDFGKGFSSLSLLKDIHADVLKIDMGFLRGKDNRLRSGIILRSVVDMAKSLGMGVITEGVETGEQVERLVAIGCENFQGFYYSRPIPVHDFETVVRERLERER